MFKQMLIFLKSNAVVKSPTIPPCTPDTGVNSEATGAWSLIASKPQKEVALGYRRIGEYFEAHYTSTDPNIQRF